MAEWLRRLTRNQIPSGSVGSNPTDCERDFLLKYRIDLTCCLFILTHFCAVILMDTNKKRFDLLFP